MKPTRRRTLVASIIFTLLGLYLLGSNAAKPIPALAASTSANIDQCANGAAVSNIISCPPGSGDWQNGDLNRNNSHYREGDSVPFRIHFTGLTPNQSTAITISWQATNSPGEHAYDYLTSWNRTVTSANPCSGFTFAACTGSNPP